MKALIGVVRSGVARRRVQTLVIALVVMVAVTSAVLGGSLIVASNGPFDRAFSQQRGAHLTAQYDTAKASPADLAASARATGVTAAAGPFTSAAISVESQANRPMRPTTLVGRADPGGSVDALTVTTGRWVSGPGEVVLQTDPQLPALFQPRLGEVLKVADMAGSASLTIVGLTRSVSETAGGWVTPEQASALVALGAPGGVQMLYRFETADTKAAVAAGRAAVESAVPADSLVGTRSWLTTRLDSGGNAVLFIPFLIAFGALGVLMAVLIVGNVVAGAVSTGTRRIGVLKALGCTPNQVVGAYLAQALIPAAVGAALGVVAGIVLAAPLLAETDKLYGTRDSAVIPWLDAAVPIGALAVVALTGWAAASRAGRLRTVDALAVGRTPRPGRGRWAARLTARLALPRPVTIGLAQPFARPVQASSMIAAVAFGVAAVTFAVGLGSSLDAAGRSESHGDVVVHQVFRSERPGVGGPPEPDAPPTLDSAGVVQAINTHAGTAGYCAVASTEVTAAGVSEALETRALAGQTCSYGYQMVDGTWFAGPGEIVVSTPFLTATGTGLGDSIVLTQEGTPITVKIVGEVFNPDSDGMQVLTDAATMAAAAPDLRASSYDVTVQPGTDVTDYANALSAALEPLDAIAREAEDSTSEFVVIINALTTTFSVMLIAVVGLGVLNMVVLETRERVHDLGVHKALGMTPRQTIAMVTSSVVVTGVIGGVLGTPTGLFVHRLVIDAMGDATGFKLPQVIVDVYRPDQLAVLALGGLLIAVLGSLLPAGWAAKTRTATALRTE